jgi:hypothetical protein
MDVLTDYCLHSFTRYQYNIPYVRTTVLTVITAARLTVLGINCDHVLLCGEIRAAWRHLTRLSGISVVCSHLLGELSYGVSVI